MNYATSSPAPTPGLSGNTPVSHAQVFGGSWCQEPACLPYRSPIPPPYRSPSPAASRTAIKKMAASLTDNGLPYTQPVCQNCQTSTTPLWRRDEAGSVLCNACGLFLKLHGRARPISLKTDVIKSRNRVKSAGQVPKKKVGFNADIRGASRLTRSSHRSTQMASRQRRPKWAPPLSTCTTP
jgi:GATA zinc finger